MPREAYIIRAYGQKRWAATAKIFPIATTDYNVTAMNTPPRQPPKGEWTTPTRTRVLTLLETGLSQSEVACETNVPRSTVSRWSRVPWVTGQTAARKCMLIHASSSPYLSDHLCTPWGRMGWSRRSGRWWDAVSVKWLLLVIHKKKELWKKQSSVSGSFVFITGHGAWHNLRYIRSLERV